MGGFIKNKRQGRGKMIWAILDSGSKEVYFQYYSGEWRDGDPNGEGMHSTEEYNYVGLFKNGLRSGKGI